MASPDIELAKTKMAIAPITDFSMRIAPQVEKDWRNCQLVEPRNLRLGKSNPETKQPARIIAGQVE
jgi:hypothetical protein